jgi:NAD(P)-dependent dehydrogenase (short-subunit alcohol dehydrogenase family)
MRGLADKVVVIAGGATGIGAATAQRLTEEGARVVVGDLNADQAERTAAELSAAGATALPFAFDIADEESCRSLIAFAVAELGGLDGLFNVAADTSSNTLGRDTDIVSVPVDVWQRTLDVNLTGAFFMARHAIPALLERGGGAIVNTLTGLVFYGDPGRPSYGASKGGLIPLTRHIAARWGKEGIRCNAVAPGFVLTEQSERNVSQVERDMIFSVNKSPRHGKVEDIAASVAFLLSDDAEWINGQMHLVNGGR